MSKKKDLSGGGKDGGLAADDKAGPDVRSKTKKPAVLAGTGSGSSAAAAALSASAGFGTAAAAPLRLAEQSGAMGPQLELVNGKMVVKESSLLLNQDTNVADGEYEEVVEGNHATATYSSFLKRRHSLAWGIEETRMFYHCLQQCGTEFSIMQSFFPGRTRKQLKAKFFREEKHHPELVKQAMSSCLPLDYAPFAVALADHEAGQQPSSSLSLSSTSSSSSSSSLYSSSSSTSASTSARNGAGEGGRRTKRQRTDEIPLPPPPQPSQPPPQELEPDEVFT